MRLVIEREGGFDIIPESDHVKRIDVQSYGVKVTFVDDTGGEWEETYPVADHTAACRLAAAIAVRCGTLVELLSEGPEVDGEAAMGAASAALVRERSRPWKASAAEVSEWLDGEPPRDGAFYECEFIRLGGARSEVGPLRWRGRWARGCGGGVRCIERWKRVSPYMPASAAVPVPASEWVDGEPPRDGSTYVAREGATSLCVRWDGKRWMAGGLPVVFGAGVEHRALGEGVADDAGVSRWVEGEPPRDGRWYVAVIGFVPASLKCPKAVRWSKAQWLDSDGVGWGDTLPLAHLLPPIPDVPVQLTQTGAGGTQ